MLNSARPTVVRAVLLASLSAVGCVGAGDDVSATPDEGAQAVTANPTINAGTAYRYTVSGRSYYWQIYRSPRRTQVSYLNTRTDGSWSEVGTVNRWARCPAANEGVQVINTQNGQSQLCTHVCLPDGREELHCPSGQIVLTPVTSFSATIHTELATRTPRTPRSTCDRRVGCLDYTSCMSCCGSSAQNDDGIIDPIEGTGCELICTFSGGDLGSSACVDPYPPSGGGTGGGGIDPAGSCTPLPGYPNWCTPLF